MSGKNILLLILSIFLLELAVLAVMGGFGKSAGKEAEEWFSIGPVAFYKHGLHLEVVEKSEFLHLDRTPEDHPTFWEINLRTTKMIAVVDVILIIGALLIVLSMKGIPGRLQGFFEVFLDILRGIVKETLGRHADRHLPTIITLFLFIWFSNLLGVIPLFSEPTRDVNVPIGQMLVMILLAHIEAIRVKGVKKYIKEYFEPFFIMLPLNVIGEMAKGVSLSFRLFGNMSGGAIIILVVSYLLKYTIMPVGLNLFFGIFIGTVQAFVFTMLSMTYIAVAISE